MKGFLLVPNLRRENTEGTAYRGEVEGGQRRETGSRINNKEEDDRNLSLLSIWGGRSSRLDGGKTWRGIKKHPGAYGKNCKNGSYTPIRYGQLLGI